MSERTTTTMYTSTSTTTTKSSQINPSQFDYRLYDPCVTEVDSIFYGNFTKNLSKEDI